MRYKSVLSIVSKFKLGCSPIQDFRTGRGTKDPILYRIDHEKFTRPPKTPWLFLLLVIRLTISNATSAKPVNGHWTRRFIAMVLIARYIVEVSFAMQQLCIYSISLPLLVSSSQLRTPYVQNVYSKATQISQRFLRTVRFLRKGLQSNETKNMLCFAITWLDEWQKFQIFNFDRHDRNINMIITQRII